MQSCEWNALIQVIHQYPKQWKKDRSSEWNAVIQWSRLDHLDSDHYMLCREKDTCW